MAITEYAATTARAFMAAEIAMALVNCGDVMSRARKPRNCLAIILHASNRRYPGPRIIPWTDDPDPSTTTRVNRWPDITRLPRRLVRAALSECRDRAPWR